MGDVKVAVIGSNKTEAIKEILMEKNIEGNIVDAHQEVDGEFMYEMTAGLAFDSDAYLEEKMPESGMIADFVFGPPHRMASESQKEYKFRLKVEKTMLKYRMRMGVNSWPAEKGVFTDPAKQAKKRQRKVYRALRTPVPRLVRIANGIA